MSSSHFVRSNILRVALRSSYNLKPPTITGLSRNRHILKPNRVCIDGQSSCNLFSTTTSSKQGEKLIDVVHQKIGDENSTVKTITMMSPKTRNSLSLEMIENLIEQMHDNSNDTGLCRCIVIKGEGKAFSAGHNLKEMTMNEGREYHEKIFHRCNTLMNSIISCPIPVIAVVDGVAAAAGCQLVAMCDIAIATETSR